MKQWIQSQLDQIERDGLLRSEVRGGHRLLRSGDQELVNFSGNDYLGFATHPKVIDAVVRGAESGFGAGASRLVTGTSDEHLALEHGIARFHGAEAACVFSSGFQMNVGLISVLVGAGDLVVSDKLNHASLIDGIRLSRADTRIIPHLDRSALLAALETSGRALVVTESIFSMEGTLAPIDAMAADASAHGAILYVDEAHAVGVVGDGTGLASAVACEAGLVRVGTFGKAFGGCGAYVVGSNDFIRLVRNRCRSYIFTTALPSAVCAGNLAGIELVKGPEGDRARERLAKLCAWFRKETSNPRLGPIFPVVFGEPERATMAATRLRELGLHVSAIRPPTVPVGTSRLRITLSACHTDADIERLVTALQAL